MISKKDYEVLYSKIEPIISEADPAALGGAPGEYDQQINQIIKLMLEEDTSIDAETLSRIFIQGFPGCNISSLEDFGRIAEKIKSSSQGR